jgi:cytochrome c556
MKKIITLLSVAIFATAAFAFAAGDAKPELRPAQKLMQARAAWLTAMNENLVANKFEAISKDADELAAQTNKVGENIPNPLGKELTLAISSLAKDISVAAAKKNGETVKVKLGEIKGKCGECHAKIRDKK